MDESFVYELISIWECEHIDFKREYHDNNACLIHDILCLSNSFSGSDRYLVIGVDDTTRKITGVARDPQRKKNSDIQDLMRASGLNRFPDLKIHTVNCNGLEVDVIKITNRPDKPFYLLKDKIDGNKRIRSGVVYTRLGDTNTPMNECAQDERVELMWRERFGIGKPPLERFKVLLDSPNDWINPENDTEMHHRIFPEFNIQEGEIINKPFQEDWTDKFIDKKAYIIKVRVKYFGTLIYSMAFVVCDGGRHKISIPEIPLGDQEGMYFIERNSIEYKVTRLINRIHRNEADSLDRRLTSVGIEVR